MDDNNTFREALKNFTFDVACGGAIEHLADCGYIPQEIQKMLDFPTSLELVQETYWKHCVKKKIIAEDKSELGKRLEKVSYVTDYDAYGHMSLRKVVEYGEGDDMEADTDDFCKTAYDPAVHGNFSAFIEENEGNTYVSCDFGIRKMRSAADYESFLSPLTDEQRFYMEGIPWKRKKVWHCMNRRMSGIITTLYEYSEYHGELLLLDKQEEIHF
jgi:hypothetical protein